MKISQIHQLNRERPDHWKLWRWEKLDLNTLKPKQESTRCRVGSPELKIIATNNNE